jgi:hypothetical protein
MSRRAGSWQACGMSKVIALPRPKSRISARVRVAVEARARNGLSLAEAAKLAGLSRQGLIKALKRPEVAALLAEEMENVTQDFAGLRQVARVEALEVARRLLQESKDESIRLRMAQVLLAAEGKGDAAVVVNVDARQGGGYEYVRPGQQVVEIQGRAEDAAQDAS